MFITTCNVSPLSEQQPVNCDTVNSGCKGELMVYSFAFAKKRTMHKETNYILTATDHITQTLTNVAGAISVSVSNFHQHVRTWSIALASRNGAAHGRCLESPDDCVKCQYVSFPFSEPVERAEFLEILADVDSVVSKNSAE